MHGAVSMTYKCRCRGRVGGAGEGSDVILLHSGQPSAVPNTSAALASFVPSYAEVFYSGVPFSFTSLQRH